MAKETKIYTCDECFKTHPNLAEAESCEANHTTLKKKGTLFIHKVEFSPDGMDQRFPNHLHVKSKDNDTVTLIYQLVTVQDK